MTKVRSRNIDKHYRLKMLIKTCVVLVACLSVIWAALSIIGAWNYEKIVNKCLNIASKCEGTTSYMLEYNGEKVTVYTNDKDEVIFVSILNDNSEDKIFFKDGKCFIEVSSMINEKDSKEMAGKTWVYVDTALLLKEGTYRANDIVRCIDDEYIKKYVDSKSRFHKGLKYFESLLYGKSNDSYGYFSSDGIVIVSSEFFKYGEYSKEYSLDIVGDYERKIGRVRGVVIRDSGVEILGDIGSINMTIIGGKFQYKVLYEAIETLSIALRDVNEQYEENFFSNYRSNKNIIESLKGAFER